METQDKMRLFVLKVDEISHLQHINFYLQKETKCSLNHLPKYLPYLRSHSQVLLLRA